MPMKITNYKKILLISFFAFFTVFVYSQTCLIGTEQGLFSFEGQENEPVPLWIMGGVKQIQKTVDGWYFLTSQGVVFSSNLLKFENRSSGIPFKTLKFYKNNEKYFFTQSEDLKDFAFCPTNSKIIVTGTKDEVFLSRDGGLSWNSLGFSVATNGLKAVAVAELPELTVFMAHSIYGVFYCQPEISSEWHEIEEGFFSLPTSGNIEEVSDILVKKQGEEIQIYGAQTFQGRIYRLNLKENLKDSFWQEIWNSGNTLDTVESLFPTDSGIGFISAGTGRNVMELVLSGETAELKTVEAYGEYLFKPEFPLEGADSVYIQIPARGELCLSELWLFDTRIPQSGFSETANEKKGMYIPVHQINYPEKFAEHKKTIKDNNLNMVVVDMKDDFGNVRFKTDNPEITRIGSVRSTIDVKNFISQMKEMNVYLVARIVVFKDKRLASFSGEKYAVWDKKLNKPWVGTKTVKVEVEPEKEAEPVSDGLLPGEPELNTENKNVEDSNSVEVKNSGPEQDTDGEAKSKDEAPDKEENKPEITYKYETQLYDENWVDPFSEEVWKYNVEIGKELIKLGFDEIQFDYIRFPTDGENLADAFYRWQDEGMDKESALMSFLSYARQEIKAPISIDVYGANGWHRSGSRTGQEVEVLSDYVDVICPMYYPNHFSQNFMAYPPEIQRPYRIYYFGSYRNAVICRNKVVIRPYAQAFYLPVSYDKKYYDEDYVQRQIFGIRDSINQGYTYWNNSGRYEDLRKDPLDTDEYPWDNKPEERSTQKINLFNCKVDLTAD